MSENTAFNQLFEKYYKTLEQYVPVVERVHGGHHPEFYDVRAEYNKLVEKIRANDLDLSEEFGRLDLITDSYKVPGDVCETYEAVFVMLKALADSYKK